jgi:hypothetical protein
MFHNGVLISYGSSAFDGPTLSSLVICQVWEVVALVQIFQYTAEDFWCLVYKHNLFVDFKELLLA